MKLYLFKILSISFVRHKKVRNGKAVSFALDEAEHKIQIRGGRFSGRNCSDEIVIPAGPFSYDLRVDFPFAGGRYYFRIAAAGEDVFEKSNMGKFLGSSVVKFLLMPEVRRRVSGVPGLRMRFLMTAENWEIHILLPENQDILLYRGDYLKVTGSGL